MVKIGTTDGWCTVCLDEAADHSGCFEQFAAALTRPEVVEAVLYALGWDKGGKVTVQIALDAAISAVTRGVGSDG